MGFLFRGGTMLVKLHDLNRNDKIDRKDAFKAPNGYYYSSEAAYNQVVEHKEMRNKCIDYMYDIMGYQDHLKMPTIFFKRLKEWEPYGFNVVYIAMTLVETSLRNTLRYKTFQSEYNKVSYITAVIENNLNDALKIENRKTEKVKTVDIEVEHLDNIGCSPKASMGVGNLLGDM